MGIDGICMHTLYIILTLNQSFRGFYWGGETTKGSLISTLDKDNKILKIQSVGLSELVVLQVMSLVSCNDFAQLRLLFLGLHPFHNTPCVEFPGRWTITKPQTMLAALLSPPSRVTLDWLMATESAPAGLRETPCKE